MSPEKDPAANLEYVRSTEDEIAELNAVTVSDDQWQDFAPRRHIDFIDQSEGPQKVTIHAKTAGELMLEKSGEVSIPADSTIPQSPKTPELPQ